LIYFIVAIGVLILVHEFGHFIAARLTKTRVDVFSIGMGFRVFGWNKINGFTFGKLPKDWEGNGITDYILSLFPLGGYVKIVGMVDESMDDNYSTSEPQPWEFRSKGTLAKLFMISAGVIMNFILAVVLFGAVEYFWGEKLFLTTTIGYVEKNSLAETFGLKDNDKIISINGKNISNWIQLKEHLTVEKFGDNRNITVVRNDSVINLVIPGDSIVKAIGNDKSLGIYPVNMKLMITSVESIGPAGKAGILENDTIISINNEMINTGFEMQQILKSHKKAKVSVSWKRGDKILSDSMVTRADGTLGVGLFEDYFGPSEIKNYGLVESVVFGWDESVRNINLFVTTISQIFKGNLSAQKSLGGPGTIFIQAGRQAERGFDSFLRFMAILSVSLALINVLPIPALDGGHLVFIIIEGIIRREIPVKVKMVFQQVGMVLLLLLMVYLIYNDITRL
jgi:regulator of sigma E protease